MPEEMNIQSLKGIMGDSRLKHDEKVKAIMGKFRCRREEALGSIEAYKYAKRFAHKMRELGPEQLEKLLMGKPAAHLAREAHCPIEIAREVLREHGREHLLGSFPMAEAVKLAQRKQKFSKTLKKLERSKPRRI